MPSRHSVPRICLDLLDNPPRGLPPSTTFDITDILSQVKLFPKLLAENFVSNDADDVLCLDYGGYSQDVPPFPIGRQPPLFTLHSHRARLPFPIRPDAFELSDFCWDEDTVCPLLTVPTRPRMKLMIREQLHVQKWVDSLTSESPPKHIPWTCQKPATKKKWTAEGSMFPVATIKSSAEDLPLGETFASSEAPGPVLDPSPCVPVTCEDVGPRIFIEETDISPSLPRVTRTSQGPSPPPLLPSRPIVTTSHVLDIPLAARRGKLLNGLELKRGVIEQLEYPDIPTAFRGSRSGWPPQSDALPVPSFTDHQSMLLDLQAKSAALGGNGVLTYIQEPLYPSSDKTCSSLGADEWAFSQGLVTFNNLTDSQAFNEIAADTVILPRNDLSAPAKVGLLPRLPSTPLHTPANRSSDPPRVPLPPRPALVNSSTPPHVRGILKKVKSVRFEDAIKNETSNRVSCVASLADHPSPPSLPPSSKRPCTPIPSPSKASGSRAPLRETAGLVKSMQAKNPAPRPRLPRVSKKLEPYIRPNAGPPKGPAPTSETTTSVERPCRMTRIAQLENTNLVTAPQGHHDAKQIAEADVRRAIEGSAKNRLSTPLRNIFRFR